MYMVKMRMVQWLTALVPEEITQEKIALLGLLY